MRISGSRLISHPLLLVNALLVTGFSGYVWQAKNAELAAPVLPGWDWSAPAHRNGLVISYRKAKGCDCGSNLAPAIRQGISQKMDVLVVGVEGELPHADTGGLEKNPRVHLVSLQAAQFPRQIAAAQTRTFLIRDGRIIHRTSGSVLSDAFFE